MERLSDADLNRILEYKQWTKDEALAMARELLELRSSNAILHKHNEELLDTGDAYAYEYSVVSERLAAAERVVEEYSFYRVFCQPLLTETERLWKNKLEEAYEAYEAYDKLKGDGDE